MGRKMRKEGRKEKKYVRLPFKTKAKMKRKSKMKVERIGKKEVRGRYGSHVGVWA